MRFDVTFRIMGDNVNPDEVSTMLSMKPDYSHKKGDSNTGKNGRKYPDYKEGLWARGSGLSADSDLDAHILYFEKILSPKRNALSHLRASHVRMDIFVGLFYNSEIENPGYSLSPEAIKALDDMNVAFSVDVYLDNR